MILNHRIIVDPEITISEFTEQDKQSLVEYLNDREIYENTFHIPFPYKASDAESWISRKLEQNKEFGQPVSFAIRNSEDRLIGAAGFDGLIPGSSHKAELGYWLAKPFRGQGIMPAVVQKLCLHAFSEFALEKVTAFTFSFNRSSQAVLEKAGFVSEGYFRKYIKKEDRFIDCIHYGLLPKHTEVTQRLDFSILNGEVVSTNASWVYVWQKPGTKQIVKLGATWLHPAARAEKHLREHDEEDAQISAFRVPKALDRSKVKDALVSRLSALGLYSSDPTEQLEQFPADSEGVFADGVLKDLGLA